MNTLQNTNGITKTFNPIVVRKVEEHKYKKGIMQAEIAQIITTTYPSARIANSKAGNIFDISEFDGLEEGKSYESTRVTWIDVPQGSTVESITARLAQFPKAKIRKELANKVELVLTEEQLNAANDPNLPDYTLESAKGRFLVKDSNGIPLPVEMYAQNFFSPEGAEDLDMRSVVTADDAVSSIVEQALNTSI